MTTLFQAVANDAACVRYLGANPVRFFEFGQAPQLETMPYATFQHITATPYNVLNGPADADHVTLQIDVWAEDGATCREIANAMRDAIEAEFNISSWLGTRVENRFHRSTFTVQFVELR